MLDMVHEVEKKVVERRIELEEVEKALKVLKKFLGITETDKNDEALVVDRKDEVDIDELIFGSKSLRKRYLIDDVRDVLPIFGKREFTVALIHDVLKQQGVEIDAKSPRPRIATALGKLVEEGSVELLFKGAGNNPYIYKAKEIESEDNDISDLLGDESPSVQT